MTGAPPRLRAIPRRTLDAGGYLAFLVRVSGWRAAARAAWLMLRYAPAIVRSGSLQPIDPAMSRPPHSVRINGVRTQWGHVNTGLWRDILLRHCYEPTAAFAPSPGDTIVDLGANVGAFAISAAVRMGSGRVIACEATPEEYAALLDNVARNGVEAIVEPHFGLVGSGGVLQDSPTPVLDLDEALAGVPEIALLKVDIEGSEFALFAAAGPWLDRVRRIAMEVHTVFGDPQALAALLVRRGFAVRTVPTTTLEGVYLYAERAGRRA